MIDTAVESPPVLLPSAPGSVRLARAFVDRWLKTWNLECLSADAILVACELVTNAIQYGRGDQIALQLARDGSAVTLRVGDDNPDPPRPRLPGMDSETGRGLLIVASYASSWGWTLEDSGTPGKSVWAALRAEDD